MNVRPAMKEGPQASRPARLDHAQGTAGTLPMWSRAETRATFDRQLAELPRHPNRADGVKSLMQLANLLKMPRKDFLKALEKVVGRQQAVQLLRAATQPRAA